MTPPPSISWRSPFGATTGRSHACKLLAKHGHRYSRQQLWNFKTANSSVPEHVELILKEERKASKSAS